MTTKDTIDKLMREALGHAKEQAEIDRYNVALDLAHKLHVAFDDMQTRLTGDGLIQVAALFVRIAVDRAAMPGRRESVVAMICAYLERMAPISVTKETKQ